jgi:hypothetical protein
MTRNDTRPPRNLWAFWVALFGWLIPVGVFYALRWQFRGEETWPQVGPYLLVSFAVVAVFSQVGALFIAVMTWPTKGAKLGIVTAVALLALNVYMLVSGVRQMQ